MGKLDRLRLLGGDSVAASASRPAPGTFPPGMDLATATRMPRELQGLRKASDVARIPVERIEPDPNQPREEFDEGGLELLAESLRTKGQLQPIRVQWDDPAGVYRIVCGERRWRAAKLAGINELTCVLQTGPLTEDERLTVQLVENALREDLKPVEQARAFRTLMDRNGYTTMELAAELGIHQSRVIRVMSLLKLPGPIQARVDGGEISQSAAYEITKAPEGERETLADRVLVGGLSHQHVVKAVRKTKAKQRGRGGTRKETSRTFRTDAGPRVTVEYGRGLTEDLIRRAMEESLSKLCS